MTADQSADRESSSPLEPVPMEPVPPPERRSRAGRNLPAAIGVGASLGALIVVTLYVWKPSFLAVVAAAVVIAVWELSNALKGERIRVPVVPVVVGALSILGAGYAGGSEPMLVALTLTVLAILLWRLPENPDGYVRDVTAGVFVTMYVPLLAGFAALMLRADDGADRVVVFIAVTVLSDIGGYVAGVLFGRHAMAPTISPKKSWEGFAGSALFTAVGGALLVTLLVDGLGWEGVVIGLAAMVAATSASR